MEVVADGNMAVIVADGDMVAIVAEVVADGTATD